MRQLDDLLVLPEIPDEGVEGLSENVKVLASLKSESASNVLRLQKHRIRKSSRDFNSQHLLSVTASNKQNSATTITKPSEI